MQGALGAAVVAARADAALVLVQALHLHQHETRGVPQLVAEIAVALAALAVEADVAPQAGECGEGEAQRVGAVAWDAVGEFLLGVLAHARRGLGLAQPGAALVEQRGQVDAVDQVHRVEHVAVGLAHLAALRVAHQAVDVDMAERHLAGEVRGHHDHPGDPEEDDVEAGDEHAAGQEQVLLHRLGRPAQRGKGHQRRAVPGVEHVLVARQRAGVAGRGGLGARFVLAACDEQLAARCRTRPGSGGPTTAGG